MRSRTPAFVLAGWTLFVWATRIRNALGDEDLSGGSKAVSVTVAALFTLGGLAVLVSALRRQHLVAAVGALAAFTTVYWPVRVVQIALADHDAAFVVVHAALGVVSVGLAAWAWVSLAGRGAPRRAEVLPRR
jgi:hypothetical protein